jgi:hypothetical protein
LVHSWFQFQVKGVKEFNPTPYRYWRLIICTVEGAFAVLDLYGRDRAAGCAVSIKLRAVEADCHYDVRVPPLPSRAETELVARLIGVLGVGSPVVTWF